MTALDKFCFELEDYIQALMDEGHPLDEAVDIAKFEYEDYWLELQKEENE